MAEPRIRLARPDDAASIAGMLRQLAESTGDGARFASTPAIIGEHGFGPDARFTALVADDDGDLVGLALFFPHFSTTRGVPGVWLSDLWVTPRQQRRGLGRRLLESAAAISARQWNAGYLALSVHGTNPAARRFYETLGLGAHDNDVAMVLDGAAFAVVAGKTERAR